MASSTSKSKTCVVICGELSFTICLLCLQELLEGILLLLVYFFHCFYYKIVEVDRPRVDKHKTKNEYEKQKVLSHEDHHVDEETRDLQALHLRALHHILHIKHANTADLTE